MMRMDRTLGIVICGKSASGKDTLALELLEIFRNMGVPAHMVVPDSTRPPRPRERDGREYNFLSSPEFLWNKDHDKYRVTSEYRGWHYGIRRDSIEPGMVNVFVTDFPNLQELLFWIGIVCDRKCDAVMCHAPLLKRLKRMRIRDRGFRWEHLRRAISDSRAYREFRWDYPSIRLWSPDDMKFLVKSGAFFEDRR